MPKPALRTIQRPIGLSKEVEDVRQKFRSNANPGIADPNDRLSAFLLNGEPDMTTFVRILRGIVEQIDDDLFEPSGIGMQPD